MIENSEEAPSLSLHHGDCLDVLPTLDEGSVSLVFADPPFNIGYDYPGHDDNLEATDYERWCHDWIAACHRVISPTGSFWIAIGEEWVSELDVLAKRVGFHKRSHVVWYYTFGLYCSRNLAKSNTHLLYYTKHKTQNTFNAADAAVRHPSARQILYNDKRANPDGRLPDRTWVYSPLDLNRLFSEDENTWLASRVTGTSSQRVDRGTGGVRRGVPQMPLEIMNRVVQLTSNPGDTVLDPFSGVASTGASALGLGRKYVGIEKDETTYNLGRERLEGLRVVSSTSVPCEEDNELS